MNQPTILNIQNRRLYVIAKILSYFFLCFGMIFSLFPFFLVFLFNVLIIYFYYYLIGAYLLIFIVYILINHVVIMRILERRIVLIFEAMSILWMLICSGTAFFTCALFLIGEALGLKTYVGIP